VGEVPQVLDGVELGAREIEAPLRAASWSYTFSQGRSWDLVGWLRVSVVGLGADCFHLFSSRVFSVCVEG